MVGLGVHAVDEPLDARLPECQADILVDWRWWRHIGTFGPVRHPTARRCVAYPSREIRPNLVEYELGDRRIVVLAEGRLVGQSAAEASPAEVMDMTFATEALVIEHLVTDVRAQGRRQAGVHEVPHDIVERVAWLKLDAFGVRLSPLSSAQAEYHTAWQSGT